MHFYRAFFDFVFGARESIMRYTLMYEHQCFGEEKHQSPIEKALAMCLWIGCRIVSVYEYYRYRACSLGYLLSFYICLHGEGK